MRFVIVFWFENLVCCRLLLVGEHSSMHFLNFYTKKAPTIGVGMFIVLENPSSASKVMERMLMALNGPPEAGEGITILIEGHTLVGTVPGSSYPMSIPPNPRYRVTISIILAHGDHC